MNTSNNKIENIGCLILLGLIILPMALKALFEAIFPFLVMGGIGYILYHAKLYNDRTGNIAMYADIMLEKIVKEKSPQTLEAPSKTMLLNEGNEQEIKALRYEIERVRKESKRSKKQTKRIILETIERYGSKIEQKQKEVLLEEFFGSIPDDYVKSDVFEKEQLVDDFKRKAIDLEYDEKKRDLERIVLNGEKIQFEQEKKILNVESEAKEDRLNIRMEVNESISEIDKNVVHLDAKVDKGFNEVEKNFNVFDKRIHTVDSKVDKGFVEVGKTFNVFDKKILQVDSKVDKGFVEFGKTINAVRKQIYDLDDKVNKGFLKVSKNFTRIDAIFHEVTSKVEQGFLERDKKINYLDQKLEKGFINLDKKFGKVDRKFIEVSKMFLFQDSKFSRIEDNFNHLKLDFRDHKNFVTQRFSFYEDQFNKESQRVKESITNLKFEVKDKLSKTEIRFGKEVVRLDKAQMKVISHIEKYENRIGKFQNDITKVELQVRKSSISGEEVLNKTRAMYDEHKSKMSKISDKVRVCLAQIANHEEAFANKATSAMMKLEKISSEQYLALKDIGYERMGVELLRNEVQNRANMETQKMNNLIAEKKRVDEKIRERVQNEKQVSDLRHRSFSLQEDLKYTRQRASIMTAESRLMRKLSRQ